MGKQETEPMPPEQLRSLMSARMAQLKRAAKIDIVLGEIFKACNQKEQPVDAGWLEAAVLTRTLVRNVILSCFSDIKQNGDGRSMEKAQEVIRGLRMFSKHNFIPSALFPAPTLSEQVTSFIFSLQTWGLSENYVDVWLVRKNPYIREAIQGYMNINDIKRINKVGGLKKARGDIEVYTVRGIKPGTDATLEIDDILVPMHNFLL